MKKSILAKAQLVAFFLISTFAFSQQAVEAKGTGLNKTDALQDALRNAVSQAVGVSLRSETRVENYMVISDAIASNTSGYIKKYSVVKEVPFPDRFEVTVQAEAMPRKKICKLPLIESIAS